MLDFKRDSDRQEERDREKEREFIWKILRFVLTFIKLPHVAAFGSCVTTRLCSNNEGNFGSTQKLVMRIYQNDKCYEEVHWFSSTFMHGFGVAR